MTMDDNPAQQEEVLRDGKPSSVVQISQSRSRAAVHKLMCILKTDFEPLFSSAIAIAEAEEIAGNADSVGLKLKPQHETTQGQEQQQLDTMEICQSLKKWCVEHRPQVLLLFAPLYQKETEKERTDTPIRSTTGAASAQTPDLFLLVHNLADSILECRTLIAHNLLSVTAHECAAVTKSVEALHSMLLMKGKTEIQDTSSSLKSAPAPAVPVPTPYSLYDLDSTPGKLLLVSELLFIIEETVVKQLQSMSSSEPDFPTSVLCVSSLCSLLRTEQWHAYIRKATGVHPRPLVLKTMALAQETVRTRTRGGGGQFSSSGKSQNMVKKYSHLDMIYMARNAFNHSPFDHITHALIAEWLGSSRALIALFNKDNSFQSALEHLSKIHEFVVAYVNTSAPAVVAVELDVIDGKEIEVGKETGAVQSSEPLVSEDDTVGPQLGPKRPSKSKTPNLVRILKKAPSKAFVGREDVLRRIHGAILGQAEGEGKNILPSQAPRVAVLVGHPAMGKSYVALQLAKSVEASNPFQIHFWITATSVELLKAGLVTLVNAVGLKSVDDKSTMSELITDVKEICRNFSCLLVLDDVVDLTLTFTQQLVSSLSLRNFVVITTCVRGLLLNANAIVEEIGPLALNDCFHLLEYIILAKGMPKQLTGASKTMRTQLWENIVQDSSGPKLVERIVCDGLGQSPLGVTLLGQVFARVMSFTSVVSQYYGKDDFSATTKDNRPLFADQHSGLDITVRYLLDRNKDNRRLLSLLYTVSIMSPNGIPLRLLADPRPAPLIDRQIAPEETLDIFMTKELVELEQTGLLYSEKEVQEGRGGTEAVYIYIHQMTQRSLRRLLKAEFNVDPQEVHSSIMRRCWNDMRWDERTDCGVGRPTFHSLEENTKWVESIMDSVFTRQILCPKATDAKEGDRFCYDKEMMDGLLLGCRALGSLVPERVDAVLNTIVVQIATRNGPLPEEEAESLAREFLFAKPAKETCLTVFSLCLSSNISLPYFSHVLLTWAWKKDDVAGALLRAQNYVEFTEMKGEDLREHSAGRPDLANIDVLVRCDLCLLLLLNFTKEQAMIEAEKAAAVINPELPYAALATRFWMYTKGTCLYYNWKIEEAAELYRSAFVKACRLELSGEISRYSISYAECLHFLERYEECLEVQKRRLQRALGQHSTKYHHSVASAHKDLGMTFSRLKAFEEAEYHFKEFIDIQRELNKSLDSKVTMFYYEWGHYSTAVEYGRQIYETDIDSPGGAFDQLNALLFLVMPLSALGPSYATEICELFSKHEALLIICASDSAPAIYQVYAPLMLGRARAWLGDHHGEYEQAQVAAAVDMGYETVIVDHLYVNIMTVAASVNALKHGVVKSQSSMIEAKEVPSTEDHVLKTGRITPPDISETDTVPAFSHSSEGKVAAEALTESSLLVTEKAKTPPLDLIPLVPKALEFCVKNLNRFRGHSDMGWLFDYAQAILAISQDPTVAQALNLADTDDVFLSAHGLALESLKYIVDSKAEVTEWTAKAEVLLHTYTGNRAS